MIAGYSTSKHLLEDRADRLMFIATTVGFGEITYKKPMEGNRWAVFTSTGIMLVTDKNDSYIITMYFANIEKVYALWDGEVPKDLKEVILRNRRKGYVR